MYCWVVTTFPAVNSFINCNYWNDPFLLSLGDVCGSRREEEPGPGLLMVRHSDKNWCSADCRGEGRPEGRGGGGSYQSVEPDQCQHLLRDTLQSPSHTTWAHFLSFIQNTLMDCDSWHVMYWWRLCSLSSLTRSLSQITSTTLGTEIGSYRFLEAILELVVRHDTITVEVSICHPLVNLRQERFLLT